jgi:hypothetical protein
MYERNSFHQMNEAALLSCKLKTGLVKKVKKMIKRQISVYQDTTRYGTE